MKTSVNLLPNIATALSIRYFQSKQFIPITNTVALGEIRISSKSEIAIIYHHLKKGSQLTFKKDGGCFMAYFKGFFIGEIKAFSHNSLYELLEKNEAQVLVKQIERKKFFPPTNIQILINRK